MKDPQNAADVDLNSQNNVQHAQGESVQSATRNQTILRQSVRPERLKIHKK